MSKEASTVLTTMIIAQPYDDNASPDDLGEEPTEEEQRMLRKVAGSVPWIAYALCVVELAERASYYGAAQLFTNFLQKTLPRGGNGAGAPPPYTEITPGALGEGLQFANAFVLLFKFLAYTLPIFGAWLGDTQSGRYKAIVLGVLICGVAHVIQVVGALPQILQRGEGLAPFLISLFVLAIGAGESSADLRKQVRANKKKALSTQHPPYGARSIQISDPIHSDIEVTGERDRRSRCNNQPNHSHILLIR
jgi:hypothetical protein